MGFGMARGEFGKLMSGKLMRVDCISCNNFILLLPCIGLSAGLCSITFSSAKSLLLF